MVYNGAVAKVAVCGDKFATWLVHILCNQEAEHKAKQKHSWEQL